MQRYRHIQRSLPDVFTDIDSTDSEIVDEVSTNQPGGEKSREALYTFAVSGSEDVIQSEVGEMQGWINVYKDEYVSDLIAQGKMSPVSNRNMVLNVAFARYPNAAPHQMASGLRQVCTQLSQIDASRQALIEEARGRTSRKIAPELVVTAYASNEDSENVLAAAGFRNKGEISLTYAETGEAFQYKLYVLDWQELNIIMHKNADKKILASKKIDGGEESQVEIRPEFAATFAFADNIIAGKYAGGYPSEESLDPREVFSGPILDLNDASLTSAEIDMGQNWIKRMLGASEAEAPVAGRYQSHDGQTTVTIFDAMLGSQEDPWRISRWQNAGEEPSYVFWQQEMYDEQMELGFEPIDLP